MRKSVGVNRKSKKVKNDGKPLNFGGGASNPSSDAGKIGVWGMTPRRQTDLSLGVKSTVFFPWGN